MRKETKERPHPWRRFRKWVSDGDNAIGLGFVTAVIVGVSIGGAAAYHDWRETLAEEKECLEAGYWWSGNETQHCYVEEPEKADVGG